MQPTVAAPTALVGVWKLVAYTCVDTDGITYPFGKAATGYLSYTAGQRMFALLQAEERCCCTCLVPTSEAASSVRADPSFQTGIESVPLWTVHIHRIVGS